MTVRRVARIVPQQYNQGINVHFVNSKTEVWVFGILKKQLLELGVTILKPKNYNGDWGFLMTVEDGEKVREAYPNDAY